MSNRRNAWIRNQHMPLLLQFLEHEELEYRWIAGDWHLRIEGVFDVFPTSQNWHHIPTDSRGMYTNYQGLQDAFMNSYYNKGHFK